MAEEKSRRRRRWLSAKMRARLDRIGHYVTFGERRPLLIFALMLLVTIAIDLCDSFGIDDATDRMIIELVEKVRGPVYGSSDGRQGQAAIALVLIGNQTLRDNDLDGLPLPYDVQATILANVAAGKPRAILYDVYFPRGRVVATTVAAFGRRFGQAGDPAMQSLADEMRRIGSTMPLLIGPVDSCAPALAPLRDVTSQGDNNRAAGVREVSLVVDPHSPRIYKPVHDQPACSEPLTPAVPGKEPPPRSLDTAAFGLYQAYCATALPGDHSRLCPLGNLADDQRPMA
ncbi:MAG: CHASE2 domain-containing protein, partial [Sphingomonadales bacterium]